MRGPDLQQAAMFSYLTLERRIPADHPLRAIRRLTDRALKEISGELDKLYSSTGRESIPPERLLRALLLMVLYSVRSERQLMEQLNYNLLFRWFVGLEMDDAVWDVTVFTKNRERLIAGEVSQQLLAAVLAEAREKELLSAEHFTVDGTLIQAWAAARSFQEKGDPPAPGQGSGHDGEVLLRDKVESKTDPEARLYKKATADNGYFSEANVTDTPLQEIDLFVAPDRQKQGEKRPPPRGLRPPTPVWPGRCGTSCGWRKVRRPINGARRWWNRSLDRSNRRADFGDSCCVDWGKCRRNGR